MVLLPVTDEQAVWILQQLPVESKLNVLTKLLEESDSEWTPESIQQRMKIDSWFKEQGVNAESFTDSELAVRYEIVVILREINRLTEPDRIINEGLREMKEAQIRNREAAVQTLTYKNNLLNLLEQAEKEERKLDSELEQARAADDRFKIEALSQQKAERAQVMRDLREAFEISNQAAESVKDAIRHEEKAFQIKTVEALALKARLHAETLNEQKRASVDELPESVEQRSWNDYLDRVAERLTELEARGKQIQVWLADRMKNDAMDSTP